MQVKELLKEISPLQVIGEIEGKEVAGIHSDSREVSEGYLFVAVPGTQTDGHDYIKKAIENGAKTVVCQRMPEESFPQITFIQVQDSSEALGCLASAFYGYPSQNMVLVGVTGTNGKTTIATLLYQMFRKLGYKTGLLSTVCNYVDTLEVPATHTTPDPIELNRLLSEMKQAGCTHVFMEVSSHAAAQKRIAGLHFKGGIFTNLTRDHLDYHQTFEAYRDAKKLFFDVLQSDAFALTNVDDKNGMFLLQNTKAVKKTYSMQTLADYNGKILESHFDGTLMSINRKEINTQFVGKFNAYNLLAVYGATVLLGENPEEVLLILSTLKPVSGRFQIMRSPENYSVVVDYAHTPDALVNVLNTIHEVLEGSGKVITVVGCGGNRDKGKRPMMAKEAVQLSDQVILTSDNPRFEEPQDILEDMLEGLDVSEKKKTLSIVDRKEAIRTACMLANTGDVVLLAGKGHEDYQDIKGIKHHFDDREIVKEIFEQ